MSAFQSLICAFHMPSFLIHVGIEEARYATATLISDQMRSCRRALTSAATAESPSGLPSFDVALYALDLSRLPAVSSCMLPHTLDSSRNSLKKTTKVAREC